ncbi:MAG: bifunctional pyrazinamidase/nicotinamidase [Segetibacter sp.]|nr:bifunctional pyrazinamidase/nicotinamidase [Segetibacter sp.]
MKALLLIDIQNDFIPGGTLPVPGGNEIIEVVNKLQSHFDLIAATQDWHPADHKSFATNHPGKKAFEEIDLNGLAQVLWPAHCVQGSQGAEFSSALNTNKIEAIFRKGTDREIDSYSGFYDNGHRKSTALAQYLKGKKVNDLYIVGLAADYCVYYTAKDAIKEGFTTYIIEDAVRAINDEGYKRAKADLINKGGTIIQSSEVR